MRFLAALLGPLSTALALATGCMGINAGPGYSNGYEHVSVEGSGSQGHALPPVGYECYPHYPVRGGYVYDVNGYYYKEHNGSWTMMQYEPSQVRDQEPEVSDPRCWKYGP
jgi:hypothetical protein